MTKQIDLRFLTPAQAHNFEKACTNYVEEEGHFPTDQIVIHLVTNANRYRKERNDVRKEYAMLRNNQEQLARELRQARQRIQQLQQANTHRFNRAS